MLTKHQLTYCGYKRRVESVVGEPKQQTCLSDARVADEKQLKQQIVRLLRHINSSASSSLSRSVVGIA